MARRHGTGPTAASAPHQDGNQAVLVISTDRRVLWSNEAACRLLSRADEPLQGLLCHSLLAGRDRPCEIAGGCPMPGSLETGRPAACTLHAGPHHLPLRAALHPVPGPCGEVAEFVVTVSPPRAPQEAGAGARQGTDELALLFTLSEMDKRGCTVREVVELLARSLCRTLERQLVAIYLPSRNARHLLMVASSVALGLRQPLEQAMGGTLPASIAVPDTPGGLLWRAFRSTRHTVLRDQEKLRTCLLEHAQSPALRQVLPGLQAVLSVGSARLVPIRNHGQPVGLVLMAGQHDLTRSARDRTQRTVESAAELLQRMVQRDQRRLLQRRTAAILSAVQDGVLGLDTAGRVSFANAKAMELLGWHPDHLGGRTLYDLRALAELPPGVNPEDVDPIQRAVLTGTRAQQVETELRHRDGSRLLVSASVAPLEEDGEVRGAVVTFSDISERKRVEDELRRSLEHLRLSLSGTVLALGRMAEMRDPYTAGHQQRVAQLAEAIATRMGMSDDMVELVRLAALVHDIGKIGVPVELLTKPGQLASHEFELMRTHTTVGWEILSQAHLHQAIADIARQHHERLDGSGYPDGLEGTRIRPEARIIAVADTVEAMASHRPYRPARGIDEALSEIFRQRGRHYDPPAVDACIQLFRVRGFTFEEDRR